MGTTQCCAGITNNEDERGLQYEYGEDKLETNIHHSDSIETSDQTRKFFLIDCQERLRKSGKLYKDPTFASQALILKQSNETQQIKCIFHRPYHFLRVKRGQKYKIIHEQNANYNSIKINHDALQYFSMLLCFLADKPQLIRSIILTQPNTYGIHAVAMSVQGIKKHIFIDDYTLCYKDRPIFSQPINNTYMWPCIIQKAWLKVKGYGSNKIQVTSPIQVFQHFLSYPCTIYSLKSMSSEDYKKFIKKRIFNKGDNSIIVTSKAQPHHKIGLSGRRNFYLICLFQFQGKTYYYLRNPCGTFDFRGIHTIISPQLQNKIKKQTGEVAIKQGNFILEEDQFIQQIEEFLIVHYNRNSTVVTQQIIKSIPNEEIFLQFELTHEEEISISYVQEAMEGDHPFYPVTYLIINQKAEQIISGITNEEGCFGVHSTNLLQDTYQRLPPGYYLIRLKKKRTNYIKSNDQVDSKIIITASRTIQIKTAINQLYQKRFTQFLINYGKEQLRKKLSQSRFRGKDTQHCSYWIGDLAIVYIRKIDKNKSQINLEVSFPNKVNLECISHKIVSQFAGIPLTEQDMVIIFEKIDLTEQTALGKYSIDTF